MIMSRLLYGTDIFRGSGGRLSDKRVVKHISVCIFCLFLLFGVNSAWADPLPAFPGAEGFGMYSLGGRGGTIYEVTDLNDYSSSPPAGSLRAAVEATAPSDRNGDRDCDGYTILRNI